MEEIPHQLIGSLSHYFQGFIHPGGAGFCPSTVVLCRHCGWHLFPPNAKQTVPLAVSTCAHPTSRFIRFFLNITQKQVEITRKIWKGHLAKCWSLLFEDCKKCAVQSLLAKTFFEFISGSWGNPPPTFFNRKSPSSPKTKNQSGVFSEPVDTYGSELGENSTKRFTWSLMHCKWYIYIGPFQNAGSQWIVKGHTVSFKKWIDCLPTVNQDFWAIPNIYKASNQSIPMHKTL